MVATILTEVLVLYSIITIWYNSCQSIPGYTTGTRYPYPVPGYYALMKVRVPGYPGSVITLQKHTHANTRSQQQTKTNDCIHHLVYYDFSS